MYTLTPRGDEGQTGLIVSSSCSKECIDFSHTPFSLNNTLSSSPKEASYFLTLLSLPSLFLPKLRSVNPPHFPFLHHPPHSAVFQPPVSTDLNVRTAQKPTLISQHWNNQTHLQRCSELKRFTFLLPYLKFFWSCRMQHASFFAPETSLSYKVLCGTGASDSYSATI